MPRPLSEFTTLTFDCYGTLIDWESGIWEALQPLLQRNGDTDLSRSLALEVFAASESHAGIGHPGLAYPDILTQVHRDLAEHLQLETDPDMDRAFRGVGSLLAGLPGQLRRPPRTRRPLPAGDSVQCRPGRLRRIEDRLEASFDAVYTAEDIGSYKPDPRNFAYMLDHLASDFGVGPEEVLHVAQSLYHDHVPAQSVGSGHCLDRPSASVRGRGLGGNGQASSIFR